MKKLLTIGLCLLASISITYGQQIKPAKVGVTYGKEIDKKNAISVKSLESSLQTKKDYTGKIEGEVISVCKSKGCFLTLKREGTKEPIMVRFTDYSYFVPEDLIGKTIILEGKAKLKEPKDEISIVADGILVVK